MNHANRKAAAADRFIAPIMNALKEKVDRGEFSIVELSELCSCTRPTVYAWLDRVRPPPVDAFLLLAQLAGFSFTLTRMVTVATPRATPRVKMRRITDEAAEHV